jgi:hypothetical protein
MAATRTSGLQGSLENRIRARQVASKQQPVLTWIKFAQRSRRDLT